MLRWGIISFCRSILKADARYCKSIAQCTSFQTNSFFSSLVKNRSYLEPSYIIINSIRSYAKGKNIGKYI